MSELVAARNLCLSAAGTMSSSLDNQTDPRQTPTFDDGGLLLFWYPMNASRTGLIADCSVELDSY